MEVKIVITRINENGRIVIPFRMRRALDLKPGDMVTLTVEEEVLRIEPHLAKVKRVQQEMKRFARAGMPASDKLVAERREEVRMEMEEWLG